LLIRLRGSSLPLAILPRRSLRNFGNPRPLGEIMKILLLTIKNMKNVLTLQEWKEVGNKTKEARKSLYELFGLLNKKLPKSQYLKRWDSAEKAFGKLQSHLDDIVCSKFLDIPNHEIINIFYGEDKK
jgi:hypothetical protein